ncbi:MAG TPA: EamA family transporter [Lacunisphaera sp.]|jgi:drug/metabolite transporter (DMT)-like permease|nr:EamA family transporter [Lacunisphaera sp.]
MVYLVVVSFLWAFSFGLIKGRLAGIDSSFISAARLLLALFVFLPFLRLRGLRAKIAAALAGIGAVQFGLMYLAYNESFRYLAAWQVALFTITTPVLVTLLADALDRRFRPRALGAALLAVAGTAVIVWQAPGGTLTGVLLVQLSNLAFAAGQILYRRVRQWPGLPTERQSFAWLYLGGFVVAAAALFTRGDLTITLNGSHLMTLAYLGLIASGLGFFLWNKGALQVNAGVLAVMNNAKVPLAVACSLLFFGESANLPRLLASLALLGAGVWLAGTGAASTRSAPPPS